MNWHKRSIFDDYRSVITKWCYVQVLWIMSTYTYLFYLSIFDSYSSQAQWILLRRRRAEVEAEVNNCFSVIANNCFRIIAQVLPNSVVHSFCFWNHSVTIILITYIEISSQFPLEFNRFIQFNQQELHIFLLKNVTLHSLSSLVLFKVVFSSIVAMWHWQNVREAFILKSSTLAIITSCEMIIIARNDEILDQSEPTHLYNHWSYYTKKIVWYMYICVITL